MILESTKVIVESLPKESIWSSSLVTSIIGSIVGGLLAFWIAYIQIKEQRKQQDEQSREQRKQQDEQLREQRKQQDEQLREQRKQLNEQIIEQRKQQDERLREQRKQLNEQIIAQRKLERKKISIELHLKEMDLQTSLLSELFKKINDLMIATQLNRSDARKYLNMEPGIAQAKYYMDIVGILPKLQATINPSYDEELTQIIDLSKKMGFYDPKIASTEIYVENKDKLEELLNLTFELLISAQDRKIERLNSFEK